jgi:hypothetical protein
MNNKERFLWLAGFFLLSFHCVNQSSEISELKLIILKSIVKNAN